MMQVLTAGANWGAEPIRDGGRLAAFRGDEAHEASRPAETPSEALIWKQTKRRRRFPLRQLFSFIIRAGERGGGDTAVRRLLAPQPTAANLLNI